MLKSELMKTKIRWFQDPSPRKMGDFVQFNRYCCRLIKTKAPRNATGRFVYEMYLIDRVPYGRFLLAAVLGTSAAALFCPVAGLGLASCSSLASVTGLRSPSCFWAGCTRTSDWLVLLGLSPPAVCAEALATHPHSVMAANSTWLGFIFNFICSQIKVDRKR